MEVNHHAFSGLSDKAKYDCSFYELLCNFNTSLKELVNRNSAPLHSRISHEINQWLQNVLDVYSACIIV